MASFEKLFALWWPIFLLAVASGAVETHQNGPWLNVILNDTIVPGSGVINGATNARSMTVLAARFNYTSALQAVKVMVRGNIGTPTPSVKTPLVVSVRNWAGGHTFTVPYNVYSRSGAALAVHDHATRYLCPADVGQQDAAVVSVGTSYRNHQRPNASLQFQVQFQKIGHWSLALDAPEKLEVEPTDPAVFAFRWPPGGPDAVLLNVTGTSAAGICTTVGVQPRVCPLALTPPELTADGRFFTASAFGALTVRKAQLPGGFFVVVLPRDGDAVCDRAAPAAGAASRKKTVVVTVTGQRTRAGYYAAPALLTLLLLLLGGAAAVRLLRHDLSPPRLSLEEDPPRRASLATSEELLLDDDPVPAPAAAAAAGQPAGRSPLSLLIAGALLLLALGVDAVLAGLRAEAGGGDLDRCYRNDLCSHAAGGVPGVNHLAARLPYVGAGLGLLVAVAVQRRVYRTVTKDGAVKIGVAHDFGLLDGVGAALVLQGVLSALVSTCPGPRTSHLDVALLYFALTALACKLFQTRRGEGAAGHYAPLLFTAVLVFTGFVKQEAGNAWYVWLALALVHTVGVIVVAIQLYVLGEVSLSLRAFRNVWDRSDLVAESPNFRMNRAAFSLALTANEALAVAGASFELEDFSHYVMLFFALHAALYLAYYLLLKAVGSREEVSWPSATLLAGGGLLLVAAVIVLCGFRTFGTELTPAGSRLLARGCLGDSVFDAHDLWHMLAAPAVLALALGLLVLDDDLLLTPRMEIPRF